MGQETAYAHFCNVKRHSIKSNISRCAQLAGGAGHGSAEGRKAGRGHPLPAAGRPPSSSRLDPLRPQPRHPWAAAPGPASSLLPAQPLRPPLAPIGHPRPGQLEEWPESPSPGGVGMEAGENWEVTDRPGADLSPFPALAVPGDPALHPNSAPAACKATLGSERHTPACVQVWPCPPRATMTSEAPGHRTESRGQPLGSSPKPREERGRRPGRSTRESGSGHRVWVVGPQPPGDGVGAGRGLRLEQGLREVPPGSAGCGPHLGLLRDHWEHACWRSP